MRSFLIQIPPDSQPLPGADAGADSLRFSLSPVMEWIQAITGLSHESQGKIVISFMAVLLVYLARRVVMRIVDQRVEDTRLEYQWSKTTSQVAFVLSFLLVAMIWLEAIQSLGTFLGLLTAGIAIALKDLVASMAGWVFILWRRPFQLGDRIQIGDQAGDVVDIRIFQFTILEVGNWVDAEQSTGRIIHVPNSLLLTGTLANYTSQFEFIWNEIPVLVTFESDWRRGKEILERILEERVGGTVEEAERALRTATKKFLIHFKKLTPKVYTSVVDSGVLLTLRFICNARQRRGTTEEVWEAVLDAFASEERIDLAYPTTRMYHNILEGKESTRVPLPGFLGRDGRNGEGK
jgi:small-conductance mechanosensitive channel